MSKTLTLEIPDEVFYALQKQAEVENKTVEEFVLEIILKHCPKSDDNKHFEQEGFIKLLES